MLILPAKDDKSATMVMDKWQLSVVAGRTEQMPYCLIATGRSRAGDHVVAELRPCQSYGEAQICFVLVRIGRVPPERIRDHFVTRNDMRAIERGLESQAATVNAEGGLVQ